MAFEFIYGSDDYLVSKAASKRFEQLSKDCDPEFGMEIVDGNCLRVDDVEKAINQLRSAAQTVGLFGGVRCVWLKNVNFITTGQLGGAKATAEALEGIKDTLKAANPDEVRILISANGIDKRLSFFKWLTKEANAKEIAAIENLDEHALEDMAAEYGVSFQADAANMFLKKVGSSARSLESELTKLSLYFGDEASPDNLQEVTPELVMELTSEQVQGEFFEPMEAFYSRRADWALESLAHYFRGKNASARPLIVAFFNRNRLLLLIKAALEAGLATAGFRGLSWNASANKLKERMGDEKTPYNLFKQNPWYLGNLAKEANRFSLGELESIQAGLIDLFEQIHKQEESTAFAVFFAKFVAKAAA